MTTSLWLDGAAPRFPRADRDLDADLVVIGGGMTGVCAAYHAVRQGLRTVLVERDAVGAGASGRNAGFLLAGPEPYYADTVARHGAAVARDVWTVNRANRSAVTGLIRSSGVECALEPTGSVVAAVSGTELDVLDASARLMRKDGFPFELLDAKETADASGADGFLGGFLIADDAQLDPARFVRGMATRAVDEGASVLEGTRVTDVRRDGPDWSVALEGGHAARAPQVIGSLNAFAPALLEFAKERVFPVRGQVLATAPGPGAAVPRPVYADHGYFYVRAAGGRVVAGGMRNLARAEEVGSLDATTDRLQAAIGRGLARHWPAAAQAAVTHRWSGTMGFSRDALPWIGEVPGSPGLLTAFGYTGHGWGYGPWAGGLLAQMAAGRSVTVPPWCSTARPLVPRRLVD